MHLQQAQQKRQCGKHHKTVSPNVHIPTQQLQHTHHVLYLENRVHVDQLSQESVTQGDIAALAMYALSTQPLIHALSNKTATEVKQVW